MKSNQFAETCQQSSVLTAELIGISTELQCGSHSVTIAYGDFILASFASGHIFQVQLILSGNKILMIYTGYCCPTKTEQLPVIIQQ